MIWIWVISKFTARPIKINWESVEFQRAIFISRFWEDISCKDLLISVDESSINRQTKDQYSWSLKIKDVEWKSIHFYGSASVITAVSSDGWHFSHIYNWSVDSEKFKDFAKDLGKFIKIKYQTIFRRTVIMLDNAAIHKAKIVISTLKENFDLVYFLPSYSPHFAPVEHFFSLFKNNISKMWKQRWISLNSEVGRWAITDALQSIDSLFVINCWWHLIRLITQQFWDLVHHLKE